MSLTNLNRIERRARCVLAITAILAFAGATLAAQTPATEASAGTQKALDITLRTKPSPLKAGDAQFEVTVKDPEGKPVTDADVSVAFHMAAMPEMKMPEMKNEVKLKAATTPGAYEGKGNVMMAGKWDVTVHVKQKGKEIGSKKQTFNVK